MEYNHKEIIERLREKKVIVFGAGLAGQGVVKILRSASVEPIYFFDNKADTEYKKMNIPVKRLELSEYAKSEYVFILAVHDMDEAIRQLRENEIISYIPAYSLLQKNKGLSFMEYQKIEAIYYYYEHYLKSDGLILHTLDFVITERCSLKCKECSNLMQYYESPCNYSLEELETSIQRLMDVIEEIYELRLIGGEPLVNPLWPQILKAVSKQKNIVRVSVYTNGTIIPTDEQCIILKESGAWMSISDYDELSKIERLTAKLRDYDIPFEVKAVPFWTKCAVIGKRNRTVEENKVIFERCCARNLATVLDNKLYGCPFIANAMNLQAIPKDNKDFVDLENNDTAEVKREIKELRQRQLYASCDFCPGRPIAEDINYDDKVPPHEQIRIPLEYFKY